MKLCVLWPLFVLVAAFPACSFDLHDILPTSDAPDAGDAGDAGDVADAADADAGPSCPSDMVLIPGPEPALSYCIERVEVDNAHYAVFLDQHPPDVAKLPDVCAWKTDFIPPYGWPAPEARKSAAVGQLDWCDAYMYCKSVGRRLCGRIGGGVLDFDDWADPNRSEWFRACSKAGTRQYPYGTPYDPDKCWTEKLDGGNTAPVGSNKDCEGGYPGLFDMSGNVYEWEDACEEGDAGPESADCRRRGGCFYSTAPDQPDCDSTRHDLRETTNVAFGVRCCKDPD